MTLAAVRERILPAPSTHRATPAEPVALRGRALVLARVIFVCYVAIAAWHFIDANQAIDYSYLTTKTETFPPPGQVAAGLDQLGISRSFPGWLQFGSVWTIGALSYATALGLAWRRPDSLVGLLVGTFLIAVISSTYPEDLQELAKTDRLAALRGSIVTFPFPAGLVLLPFVFPDGRFVPRWTAWVAGATLLYFAAGFFPYPRENRLPAQALFDFAAMLIVLPCAIWAIAYRYRCLSDDTARRQLRLVGIGMGTFVAFFILLNVAIDYGNFDRPDVPPRQAAIFMLTVGILFNFSGAAVGILLAASVVRDRLFDIEVIINRALALLALTICVVVLYVSVVGGIATLFDARSNGWLGFAGAGVVAVAFQPLRARLQRAADRLIYGRRNEPYAVLSELGRRLQAAIVPGTELREIVAAVTETLKLPYAAISLGDDAGPAVESGQPAPIALRLPLTHLGEELGTLSVATWPGTPLASRDRLLLSDLARHAGAAIQAARLTQDLVRSRERLVMAREEERRRLRRDLHDGLGPRLAGMVLRVDTVREQVAPGSGAEQMLEDMGDQLTDAVADIRRLVYGLRPPALDELGLVEALRQSFVAAPGQPAISVHAPEALPALPAAVEVAAFRLAQEAVTNVIRHAGAQRCTVRLESQPGRLQVEVSDDGRGIPGEVQAGVGLASMRERAEELGGRMSIESGPGQGTVVRAILPFTAEEPRE